MAKYKPYDYAQTQLVAVSLEEQLVPGTLEHTIRYVVETGWTSPACIHRTEPSLLSPPRADS